jgi:hypothetical protein
MGFLVGVKNGDTEMEIREADFRHLVGKHGSYRLLLDLTSMLSVTNGKNTLPCGRVGKQKRHLTSPNHSINHASLSPDIDDAVPIRVSPSSPNKRWLGYNSDLLSDHCDAYASLPSMGFGDCGVFLGRIGEAEMNTCTVEI